MPTYGSKWPQYAKQWDSMKIHPNKLAVFKKIALRLFKAKDRYLEVEKATGVPWYMVAVIHERESSQNWRTQLAQGDPLNRRSTHVPRGRGPFSTWEIGAYDALVTLKKFNNIKDWRLEKILYNLELYNGWGYHNKGVPSAYIWAGSNVYRGGKYIADGVWSSSAVDTQPGVAPLIKCLMDLDLNIKPARETKEAVKMPEASTGAVIVAGGGAVATQTDITIWPYIIAGTFVAAIIGFLVVRWYRKRIKPKVDKNVE